MADDMTTPEPTDLVRLERRDDGVAIVTLTAGKVNALSTAVLDELRRVADALTSERPGCVVVTGGPKIFAAGADISEFGGPAEAEHVGAAFLAALDAIASIPRPTIASVSGFALGGGCELALACDLRVASARARFGQPEILLGIIPGGGGTQRLARLVGPSRAKDLIFTGRQVHADEALRIGLIDRLVEPDELEAATLELAVELARGPHQALGIAKSAIDEGLTRTLGEGLAREQELFRDVFATDDARVGVASFREHGPGRAVFNV